jgi:hypothetical protein
MHLIRKSVLVGSLGLALVAAGAGVATADTPRPPASPLTAAPRPVAFLQRDDRPEVLAGTVARADGRTLVVRTSNRRTAQVSLTPRTEITKNGRRVDARRLNPGDRVRVVAVRGTATRVEATGR